MFTKLFSSITDSTIWREPDHVRIVWITMLAKADASGFVWASIPGLADAARVSMEQCLEALEKLKSPDEWSRTKEFEGRRIADIEGGWSLLNYEKYRKIRNSEERREYIRGKVAEHRRNVNNVNNVNKSKHRRGEEKRLEDNKKEGFEDFNKFWSLYPRKAAKADALKAWKKLEPSESLRKLIFDAIGIQSNSESWKKDGGKFIPYPASWLNGARWEDEIKSQSACASTKMLSGADAMKQLEAPHE